MEGVVFYRVWFEHWGERLLLHLKSVYLFRGIRSSVNSTKLVIRLSPHYLLLVLSALLFTLCAMPLSIANAKTVTLGWDSNDEPDLEGYVIYRNTNSPGPPYSYSDTLPENELDDPLHPKATLTGLQEGKEYYIALTAYNTDGVESGFSNEICAEVVNNTIKLCSASTNAPASTTSSGGVNGSSGGSGGGGGGCFISVASHSPSDKNLLLYILFTITAIGLGTYGCKRTFR